MRIIAKIFDCDWETYKKIYVKAIELLYKEQKKDIDEKDIKVEIEELQGINIYAKRSNTKHSRTISIYEDNKLKYIIGLSNTNYDEDKQLEKLKYGGKYVYGRHDYHSNTYLVQGINKIFEYYFNEHDKDENIKLYFYLLDTDKDVSYVNNASNLMYYRKLATIGFDILNINEINFDKLLQTGFSLEENNNDIKYVSFNKFANDILATSKGNSGNIPSYLKCIDKNFDILKDDDDEKSDYDNEYKFINNTDVEYIYTFKTLSAEGYDSFLNMWALNILAKKEGKNLKFRFGQEKYNLSNGEENIKYTSGFTQPVNRLIEKLGIRFENDEEEKYLFERENSQYEIAKAHNKLRNQELFKNNLRKKGIQTKCYLCGCEIEEILQAAHLWGVSDIKHTDAKEINSTISDSRMTGLIDKNDIHSNELFYKKYMLANSGDNGVWLCNNHHGLFDSHYFCFDSESGKVIIDLNSTKESKAFFDVITTNQELPKEVLSEMTQVFLEKREAIFKQKNHIYDLKSGSQ